MIPALSVILGFQLVGEVLSRWALPVLPGPVIGMVLLLAAMVAHPPLADRLRSVAQGILAHLSLLFVPAGVGVVGHLATLRENGLAIAAAVVVSTVLAIAVGALTFRAVARLTERPDA